VAHAKRACGASGCCSDWRVNVLDIAVRRFPRVVAACALLSADFARQAWLVADGDTVERIIAEYHHIRTMERAT